MICANTRQLVFCGCLGPGASFAEAMSVTMDSLLNLCDAPPSPVRDQEGKANKQGKAMRSKGKQGKARKAGDTRPYSENSIMQVNAYKKANTISASFKKDTRLTRLCSVMQKYTLSTLPFLQVAK